MSTTFRPLRLFSIWKTVILLAVASHSASASLLKDIRPLSMQTLSVSSQDSSTKWASYKSSLLTAFPEIGAGDCLPNAESSNELGSVAQFVQIHNGIRVMGSNAWVKANPAGQAQFAGIRFYGDIPLDNESFLEDANDQVTLREFAMQHCEFDSIANVEPWIWVDTDSMGLPTDYHYALLVIPFFPSPALLMDWANGDSLLTLRKWPVQVYGELWSRFKGRSDDQMFSSGRLETAWHEVRGQYGYLDGENWTLVDWSVETRNNGIWPRTGLVEVGSEANWPLWTRLKAEEFYVTSDGVNAVESMCVVSDAPEEGHLYAAVHMDTRYGTPAIHGSRVRGLFYNVGQDLYDGQVFIYVDDDVEEEVETTTYYASNANGPRPVIHFGRIWGRQWSEYRDVVTHEYGHVVQLNAYGPQGIPAGQRLEGWASSEGLADIVAFIYGSAGGSIGWSDLVIPGNDGPVNRNIAPQLQYEDYDVNHDPNDNGLILSAALWDYTQLRVFSQHTKNAILLALLMQPTEFPEWAFALLTALDNNNVFCDGAPNGDKLYRAFYLNHGIPCRPDWNSPIDGWQPYHFADIDPAGQATSTSEALGTSETGNIVKGQFGYYSTYESQSGSVVLGWLPNGQQAWKEMQLSTHGEAGIYPSIAIRSTATCDELFITWQGEYSVFGPTVHASLISVCGTGLCDYTRVNYNTYYPAEAGDQIASPVCCFADEYPVMFVGAAGQQTNLLRWLVCDHQGNALATGEVNGTNDEPIRHVSVCSESGSDEVHVGWISDDNVNYRHGTLNAQHAFDWNSPLVTVFDQPNVISRNLTMTFSPDIGGVCLAWEDENATMNDMVRYRFGHWDGSPTSNPGFNAAGYLSLGECGHLRAPSLSAFYHDDTPVPDGYPRIGLAYEKFFDTGDWQDLYSRVEFIGLSVNDANPSDDSQWHWIEPVQLLRGTQPSLGTATPEDGFALLYLEPSESAPYNLIFERIRRPYWGNLVSAVNRTHTVTGTEVLYAPLSYAGDIVVEEGGDLTITRVPVPVGVDCGGDVSFLRGTGIAVEEDATLQVVGTSGKEIEFGQVDTTNSSWGGIKVTGGTLNMDYVEMKDCDTVCVWTYKPEQVSITNCVLHGDKMVSGSSVLRLYGNPEKSQYIANTQIMNAPYATGLYANGCDVTFENVEIKNCYANSYISSVTGNFRDCAFAGRTIKHGVMFLSTGNTPNFQCCQFEDLSPLGGSYQSTIYAMDGSAPSFGYVGLTQGASNTVSDSSEALLKMFGSGVLPIIANGMSSGPGGKNDWYQRKSSGYNLYWGSPYPKPLKQYYAKQQYWDPAPATLSDFYPSDASYFEYSASPARPWDLCGDGTSSVSDRGAPLESGLDDADPVYDSLFALAMSHEILREFALSQPLFRTIVREEDDYYLSWLAMTHAASNQRFLQDSVDGSWIVPMIDSLVGVAPDSMDYDAAVAGGRLKANFYVSIYEHEAAIDELADLLESDLTERDSLLVSLELLDAYVAAGLIEDDGSLDGTTAIRVPSQLRVKSDAEAWAVEQEIVERLGQIMGNNEPERTDPLPTEFRLYQNYPNPFNPSTEFSFDLPEGSIVELKVFDILGREVATVVDKYFEAGTHHINWDSRSTGTALASGVYIYQIKAGGFTDAKKMILLR